MSDGQVVKSGQGTTYTLQGDDWVFKAVGDQTGGQFDFIEGTVSYAQGAPLHVHHEQSDTFYVLEGTLTVQIGDEVIELAPGDFATAPPGTPHTYTNADPDQPPVRVINVVTPGGFDKVLAEVVGIPPGPPDPEMLAELSERHKMAFVGPPLALTLGLTDGH
ncbi:MAG: cupin domain-containing protein [Acidimicrobiales bacterium]